MNRYVAQLQHLARNTMPTLTKEVDNASTPSAQHAVLKEIAKVLNYLVRAALDSATSGPTTTTVSAAPPPPPPAPRPSPRPVPPPPPPPADPSLGDLPPLPPLDSSVSASPGLPTAAGLPPNADVKPGVVNVFATPNGTTVVAPTGAVTQLAAGEAIPPDVTTGVPELPPAEPGVEQVVLPPGGGMTEDVAAALANRQG